MSNVADSISGHRTNSNESNRYPQTTPRSATTGTAMTLRTQMRASLGCCLTRNERLQTCVRFGDGSDGGRAYSSTQNASVPADPFSFDPSTFYWLPGIKRNSSSPYEQQVSTSPAHRASSISRRGSCEAPQSVSTFPYGAPTPRLSASPVVGRIRPGNRVASRRFKANTWM